jgi:hypothetical protein
MSNGCFNITIYSSATMTNSNQQRYHISSQCDKSGQSRGASLISLDNNIVKVAMQP